MEKGLEQLKRLNKILIVFFVFSFFTIYGGWRFIHSRKFSDQASQKVSEILTKKFGAKLAFKGVDFNVFPPSTIFKNIHIEKIDPELADIDLYVEELTVSFTYSSFFSSDLEIDDLILKNGALKIVIYKTKKPDINWKELDLRKIYNQYSDLLMKSPLRLNIARLFNINVQIDNSNFLLDSLSLAPHRKEVLLKVEATQLHIDHQIKDVPLINLDRGSAFLHLTRDQWKVESLHLEKDQNKIDLDALFFNRKKMIQVSSNTSFDLNIESLIPLYPKIPKELLSLKGDVNGKLVAHGDLDGLDAEISIGVRQFKSDWVELGDIRAELQKKNSVVTLNKLFVRNSNERYELLKPQAFFDLKKNAFLHVRAPVYLRDAFTNTFLYALKGTLESFKGYLTGRVEVVWDGEKVFFEIHESALVKDFKLLSTQKIPILQNSGFSLENTVLSLDKNYKLGIDATLGMANSLIKATGEVTGKDLTISIKDSKLDMKSFGTISGLAIAGAGSINAEIHGPFNNVKFDFIVDWNNFSIVDLNFGKVKSEFRLSLKTLQIDINKLSGIYNQSTFTADGMLNFGDKPGMDIKLDFKNTNFNDAQKMYNLVFKNIKLPVHPEFNFSTAYHVRGGYNVENLKIDGTIQGTDLKVFDEEAERLSLGFGLENNLLTFKDVKINKSRGEINADVTINLANNYTELDGSLQGLRLRDFNFYRKLNLEYDGDLLVDFDGNGIKENFSSRFKTKVNNSFIQNLPASPSSAVIYLNTDEVVVNANLLLGKIKLDSLVNFKTRQVSLKSNLDTTDIREILGIFSGHNMSEKMIGGKITAQLNSQFNMDTLVVNKFFLDFAHFNLKKGDVNLSVDPKHNFVAIDNGLVKSWDLRFTDKDDFFISKAKNLSSGGIVYDQSFSLKTSLLEFATNSIDKAVGVMKGVNQLVVDKKMAVTKFEIKGIKNSLKIKNLPGAITDLEYGIVKKGDVFEISRFTGNYGEGAFKVSGNFIFDDLYPQVNIDYKIERSTISLFKRSNILISSNGTITGTDLPYKLNGKVTLLYGEFLDDPNDFTKANKVNLDSFKKYLPQKNVAAKKGYINLNMSFDTVNPILLKNNLAEVYAKGSGQLAGDILDPEINARVEVISAISKFKFKGHDFLLNQGYVEIRDRGKVRVSDLKFTGLSKINDYDVKLDISGSIEKSNINLSSEPPLAQEDLVSLLTLGVTSDMSKNLEANDRKSVTTVGIGTLLVDQLKINEDLNSTLGLNLSVLPEFKEDETSLISGNKSAVSESGASKLKTATKIKIKKPINKLIDVAVSSTVGGSIEPTQEVNINFNINKNFSLEGVYEIKPAEEENTNTSNSVGADLKYRRSF